MTTTNRMGKRPDHNMVFQSGSMRAVSRIVEKAAPTTVPVLILGESGTGKELVARAIHDRSKRSNRPFVAVNCAALNYNLLESELFGHEKGAFTGATRRKPGLFEQARGGTIFLDEIGEMPGGLQSKLLRVLQEKEFTRVGGSRVIETDARVVCATNRDLAREVRAGRFREDLFYRVNVVAVQMPPLRERRQDVPLLIDHFVSKYASAYDRPITGVSERCRRILFRYGYPGNVRELENIIQRAVVLVDNTLIKVADLPDEVCAHPDVVVAANETACGVRGAALRQALESGLVLTEGGPKRRFRRVFRCVTSQTLSKFLAEEGRHWFSRQPFAKFLRNQAESDTDKYKTAGVYLKILCKNAICEHNGEKANKSRYRLAERYIAAP